MSARSRTIRGVQRRQNLTARDHGFAPAADERFRWALGRMWLDADDLPPDLLARVVRASGGEIKPLGWLQPAESPDAAT